MRYATAKEVRIASVEKFEAPASVKSDEIREYQRRFAILRLDETKRRYAGDFALQKAYTAKSKAVAIKTCAFATSLPIEMQWKRLREEFATLCRMSVFHLYPTAFGIGEMDGIPVLIEEWVEGIPLESIPRALSHITPDGRAWPLDVAIIGAEAFRYQNMLARYGSGNPIGELSPHALVVDESQSSLSEQMAMRQLDLRSLAATAQEPGISRFLLALIGKNSSVAPRRDRAMAPTRDERRALVEAVEYGESHGFDAYAMQCLFVRWIRVHNQQHMLGDGSASYSVSLDPFLFVPSTRKENRGFHGLANNLLNRALDQDEANDKGTVLDMSNMTLREQVKWQCIMHAPALFAIGSLACGAFAFAFGWSLFPLA